MGKTLQVISRDETRGKHIDFFNLIFQKDGNPSVDQNFWLSTNDPLAAAAVVSGLVVAHQINPQRSAEGFTSGQPTAH